MRIDQKYRAIIAFQKESGVYIVLHIDNHDDAYDWACTKRVEVNQYTKTIQMYDVVTEEDRDAALRETVPEMKSTASPIAGWKSVMTAADPERSTSQSSEVEQSAFVRKSGVGGKKEVGPLPDTYMALNSDDMLCFGVPEAYVPIMLTRKTWEQFNMWIDKLPDDAASCLQFIVEGWSKDEVRGLVEDGRDVSDRLGLEQTISSDSIVVPDDGSGISEPRSPATPPSSPSWWCRGGGSQTNPRRAAGPVARIPAFLPALLCGSELSWTVPSAGCRGNG